MDLKQQDSLIEALEEEEPPSSGSISLDQSLENATAPIKTSYFMGIVEYATTMNKPEESSGYQTTFGIYGVLPETNTTGYESSEEQATSSEKNKEVLVHSDARIVGVDAVLLDYLVDEDPSVEDDPLNLFKEEGDDTTGVGQDEIYLTFSFMDQITILLCGPEGKKYFNDQP